MAKKQRNELAAGVFVIIALAAGVGVLLWLGAADLFAKTNQQAVFYVTTEFGSVGLAEGNFVRINDAEVGQIAEVRYDAAKGRTYYLANIDRSDIEIHADGKAHVAAGLVGAGTLIVTHLGSDKAPLADEANAIQISGGLAQAMKDLASAVEVIKQQLDPNEKDAPRGMVLSIVAELRSQTDPDVAGSLLAKVHGSIDDVNQISADLAKQTDLTNKNALLAKIHVSADNVQSLSADAAGMAKTIRPDVEATVATLRRYTEKDIGAILTKLRTANTDLVSTVANLKVISAEGRELIVLNRKQLEDTIVNLKFMSENLSAASREIRRNPWRLLHRPSEKATDNETLYDAARAFGEGASQLADAIARLQAVQKAKGQLDTGDPLLKKISGHLEASYEKFSKAEKGLWNALKQ